MLKLPKDFDRTNGLVAAGLFLGILFIYARTQAPTLSFWDCGEFIATSHILGIPHPPGTPTYVLFGRIFSLIPTFTDICARVNFLSGLCSALAAMFGYLFAVRLLRYWFTDLNSAYTRFLIYAGAAAGAAFMAFGLTQWNNSVEAEVYGMSMLLTFAIAWLTVIYYERRDSLFADRVMLLIVYLAFLGIGVHMATFLILPASLLFFILKKRTPVKYWFLLAGFVVLELYLVLALSSRPHELPYFIPVVMTFFFYLCFILAFERVRLEMLIVGGGFLVGSLPALAAAFGFGGDAWTLVGGIGYAGLILYGAWLVVQHVRGRGGNESGTPVNLMAGVFVLVSAVLTGILQLGLENGPFGYRVFLLLTVGLALSIGLVLWKYIRLPILVALAGLCMIILGVREFFWGTIIVFGIVLLIGLIWKVSGWKTALLVIFVAVSGYSTHLFAPIRSSLNPYINENSPGDSVQATINFFERKQYGSQSMTERMFNRRSDWANQFGDHIRMGFWGFFEEQYGINGRAFVVLLLLGIFGAWEASRRRPELGMYLVVLLLVSTVGLILYMNFADGTRQTSNDAWLEVRDRDYFFTPGFMLFGLCVGLGITATVQLVRDLVHKFSPGPRTVVLAATPVLFLLPVFTVANNYNECDRSEDYIPYDYAHNILMSAEQNGVIFTFGDNDTFPLWCLQEVYGVRKDLKLICCALSNGDWYIKQIRDYMGLDLGWNDQDIEKLRPFRTQDGRTFRIQDQVLDAVVAHNITQRSMYYSLLAYPGGRKLFGANIDTNLELSGLCFRLTDSASADGPRIDIRENLDFFIDSATAQFRGWTNPGLYQSESTRRSVRGVAEQIMMVAEKLLAENRKDEAIRTVKFIVDSVYNDRSTVTILAELYAERGDTTGLRDLIARDEILGGLEAQLALANAYLHADNRATAVGMLTGLLTDDPGCRDALNELMRIYIAERDVDAMVGTLETWMMHNPNDAEIGQALAELRAQLEPIVDTVGDTL